MTIPLNISGEKVGLELTISPGLGKDRNGLGSLWAKGALPVNRMARDKSILSILLMILKVYHTAGKKLEMQKNPVFNSPSLALPTRGREDVLGCVEMY